MHIYIADLKTICNSDDLIAKLSPKDFVRYRSLKREIRAKQFLVSHSIADSIKDKFNYISIAHKDNFVVVASSSTPIGVDIENVSKHRDFDSLAEFMQFDNVESLDDFYRLFTLFEANYKVSPITNLNKHFYKFENYIICIVCDDKDIIWENKKLIPKQI